MAHLSPLVPEVRPPGESGSRPEPVERRRDDTGASPTSQAVRADRRESAGPRAAVAKAVVAGELERIPVVDLRVAQVHGGPVDEGDVEHARAALRRQPAIAHVDAVSLPFADLNLAKDRRAGVRVNLPCHSESG